MESARPSTATAKFKNFVGTAAFISLLIFTIISFLIIFSWLAGIFTYTNESAQGGTSAACILMMVFSTMNFIIISIIWVLFAIAIFS